MTLRELTGAESAAVPFGPACDAEASLLLDPHCPQGTASAERVTFHYTIHNLGARPVRHGTYGCSGSSITPEYRDREGLWKVLPQLAWACTANVFFERVIPAHGQIDGYFTLRHLTPGWNSNPLREAGIYHLRFTFSPQAGFASGDGSFCLYSPHTAPTSISAEIVLAADAATGDPYPDL